MTSSQQEIVVRLADDPTSTGRARDLARHLRGAPRDRIEDARLLLHELVAAALYEGVDFVDVRIAAGNGGGVRIEVIAPDHPHPGRHDRRLTPAAQLGRHLIEDLSDRHGEYGTALWCELDGAWTLDIAPGDEQQMASGELGVAAMHDRLAGATAR